MCDVHHAMSLKYIFIIYDFVVYVSGGFNNVLTSLNSTILDQEFNVWKICSAQSQINKSQSNYVDIFIVLSSKTYCSKVHVLCKINANFFFSRKKNVS